MLIEHMSRKNIMLKQENEDLKKRLEQLEQ